MELRVQMGRSWEVGESEAPSPLWACHTNSQHNCAQTDTPTQTDRHMKGALIFCHLCRVVSHHPVYLSVLVLKQHCASGDAFLNLTDDKNVY